MTRILTEPFVVFLAIGAALFAVYAWVGDAPPPAQDQIVLTPDDEVWIAQQFETTWCRPPTEDEANALMDGYVRQEVMVREAVALGLDQNDAVIRQRLQQKMEFLLNAAAESLEPTDAELMSFLQDHPDKFAVQPRLAFEQVYLGDSPTDADVQSTLAALENGQAPETLGQRTLLAPATALLSPGGLNGSFGPGVFERAWPLPDGLWSGPIQTGYGLHLVRVTNRETGHVPGLDEIRDKVLTQWRLTKADELSAEQYQRLLSQYDVLRAGPSR